MLKIHPLASRSRPSTIRRLTALMTAWSVVATTAWGLAPFSPPPAPQSAPSVVNTPQRTTASPITASPTTASPIQGPTLRTTGAQATSPTSPTTDSPVTPTVSSGVQPLEGAQIVARIDGQIVLSSDVMWQVDRMIEANRNRIPPGQLESAKRMLLRQQVMGLIDTKMLYANFRRQVPAENIPSIEENLRKPFEESEIPRLLKMLKLKDRNELAEMMRKSGSSIGDLQRQFNERTIAGEWLRQMVKKPKQATHEEMLAYYNEHKKVFEFPSQVKWEEVMIRIDGDRAAAWRTITGLGNEVWQRVSKQPGLRGPVFTEIAKRKSHGFTAEAGGFHDWTTQGALRSAEINQALFSLQVGQLSNVIESDRGFHIVRVLDRKTAGRTPFTEAQAEIRKALGKDQKKGLAQAEVVKLRKKSRVWTVFDGDLSGPAMSRKLQPTLQR